MTFKKEPEFIHGTPSKTAVVLVNLGTPDEPTASAVRRYLKEFLSDPRVVEIPRAIWWCILHGIILPFRSSKSAQKYAAIWTKDGSPLKVHTAKQATLLRGYLGERGHQVEVVYAMRYGNPSLPAVLDQLKIDGCDRILIVPAYPQYSATTTASIFDAVFAHYKHVRNLPELRLMKQYHDHDAYIAALETSVLRHWVTHGMSEKLVMSFHGVPKRTLTLGDPYHCQCLKTARLLAQKLKLSPDQYVVTFQSRFGKAEWLQPYTATTIQNLAKQGLKRVDVICPGFTSDCLETLEEIAMEVKNDFVQAGGKEFYLIPCLNEAPAWIEALAIITEEQLMGWATQLSALELTEQKQLAIFQKAEAVRIGA